ncbi:transporter [Prolixibacter bellariivorans]|uniref:Transporter n=1 Tax=Prolixibacter bellariivorans TaxID=314319 RepID=A0A5M4AU63_9BACT|nr:TolC family protein [Prolixibacter bellariivorans]GET31499.1 transporter [Prolixibacter bellariivorans]
MRKVVLIVTFLFAGLATVFALPPKEMQFTLKQAQDYALEYNKKVKNAKLDVDAAQKKVWESIASGLPQIDAKADYSNYLGASKTIQFGANMPPTVIPFKPTSNVSVSVSQLLFSGSYLVGLQTAKIYKSLSETNYEKSQQDIKEQVANSYYLILVSEQTRDILKKNLENLRSTLAKTKQMEKVGMAESTDVDQLSVSVSTLENGVRSADRQVEMAYNMLRFELGVPAEQEIHLTQGLETIINRINFTALMDSSMSVENNLDYQVMETQEKLSEKQLALEKSAYLPTLSSFYNHTEKVMKPNFDASPKDVVGLNLSIPIFSSGLRKAKVSQANISLEQTQNQKDLLEEQLKIQEKQLRFNLRNAFDKYTSQKENVKVALRVNRNFDLKYEHGIASSLERLQANDNYLQAENNFVGATMELLQAYVAWEKLLNDL